MAHLTIDVCTDTATESPSNWTLYSFSRRHANYKDPSELSAYDGTTLPSIQRRLHAGTAFLVSYYEHSSSQWGLLGEVLKDRFDTVSIAGVLLWENPIKDLPKGFESRKANARSFLKEYTKWTNGECYYYSITDEKGRVIDSCGGFIGADCMTQQIKHTVDLCAETCGSPLSISITGDSAGIIDGLDLL